MLVNPDHGNNRERENVSFTIREFKLYLILLNLENHGMALCLDAEDCGLYISTTEDTI